MSQPFARTPEEWDSIASQVSGALRGQCLKDIDDVLEEMEIDGKPPLSFYAALDNKVFCCIRCGWWCEQSQMSEAAEEEWFCEDCEDD